MKSAGFSHCRQAVTRNLLASTCCFSVSGIICSAQTMLYSVKGYDAFYGKRKDCCEIVAWLHGAEDIQVLERTRGTPL